MLGILISFRLSCNYCRVSKDSDNKKIIVEGYRRKRNSCITKLIQEFPDTDKGHKQSFRSFLETFDKIFSNEQGILKDNCDNFVESLEIKNYLSILSEN